ncbi:hypothetical protein BV22DRAFT_1035153 [Leucogyrophana mollusca]|uniref:Uncharacterized protein n=1 Tax=Leucogyrophana mollusca TaxID=85980 RepID=A0ACB8BGM2_9AGAM|nr:hypothetical protein BV22DRAFT_1035153 [Leucogyrophana mollusca]
MTLPDDALGVPDALETMEETTDDSEDNTDESDDSTEDGALENVLGGGPPELREESIDLAEIGLREHVELTQGLRSATRWTYEVVCRLRALRLRQSLQ